MDYLPAELWLKVFEELYDVDLVAVSTTCSRFRDLAQVHLYREVHIECFKFGKSILGGGNMFNFARAISERPELAALVRTLEFDNISLFGRCPMASFSNIRTLRLSEISMDSSLCTALLTLPCLSSIGTFHCEVRPRTSLLNLALVPDRNIDLHIVEPHSGEGWNVLAPGGLLSLTIHTMDTQFPTNILANAMLHGQNSNLTALYVQDTIPSNIVPFLVSSPNLLRLTLSEMPRPPHDIYSLPGDAIPRLEFFSVFGGDIRVVIEGRPVRTVEFGLQYYPRGVPVDILLSLQSTSVPITKLILKGHYSHDVTYLLQAPTTLHHLRTVVPVTFRDS